jgi:hypothetical protein
VLKNNNQTWSFISSEEHSLKVFDSRVLWKIFGHMEQEITGECRKLHYEELHHL